MILWTRVVLFGGDKKKEMGRVTGGVKKRKGKRWDRWRNAKLEKNIDREMEGTDRLIDNKNNNIDIREKGDIE